MSLPPGETTYPAAVKVSVAKSAAKRDDDFSDFPEAIEDGEDLPF